MIIEEEMVGRPEPRRRTPSTGWTGLHSWIFLIVVICAVLFAGLMNRYQYLSPTEGGKTYRADKLFGSIQELDLEKGWIKANPQPSSAAGKMSAQTLADISSVIKTVTQPVAKTTEPEAPKTAAPPTVENPFGTAPTAPVPAPTVAVKPQTAGELSPEAKLKMFQSEFPEYGKEEFQLANDDLYPNWKKALAPNGTWPEFLAVYKEFIQWWTDSGSPPEPGFKLWRKFMATKKK